MGFLTKEMPYGVMLICGVMAVIFMAFYAILYFCYHKKYADVLDAADSKIFTAKELYFSGFGIIEIWEKITGNRISHTDKAMAHVKELIEVFGRDNAEFFFYVERAGMISMLVLCIPLGFMAGCVSGMYIGLLFGLLIAALLVNGVRSHIKEMIKQKKDEIVVEFPQMVSKMTLLINAGMAVRRAWDEVACSNYENKLYEEMRVTSMDIQQGMAIEDAVNLFAQRCATKEVRKFASIYVQAVQKGASESIKSMKEMSEAAWEEKKQLARQKGATAAQKLTIPNMLMFVGLLLLVIGPMGISLMSSFSL